MPKIQVYLPEKLYERVKRRADRLNVSNILQAALEDVLAEIERQEALDAAVRSYEAEHGVFTDAAMATREAADRHNARRVTSRRRRRSSAA